MASRKQLYEDAIKKLKIYSNTKSSNDYLALLLGGNLTNVALTDLRPDLDPIREALDPIVDLINGGKFASEIIDSLAQGASNDQTAEKISSLVRFTVPQTVHGNDSVGGIVHSIQSYEDLDRLANFTDPLNLPSKQNTKTGTKELPSLAVIELFDPNIGVAVRETVGLSVFSSMIPPQVISRAVPYVSLLIRTPQINEAQSAQKKSNALSLTRYLKGKVELKNDSVENLLSFGFRNEIPTSGMELFTSPQTMTTLHDDARGSGFAGSRPIDRFRPLMTLTDISFEQAGAGAGMISYKQGNLNFVLHDRGRLSEILPFVKPGAYQDTEVEIEYGWSIDPRSKNATVKDGVLTGFALQDDVFAQFIDSLRIKEKYQVTNSTFNFDDSGQVNVSATIWMKGAAEIRSLDISGDIGKRNKQAYSDAVKNITTLFSDRPGLEDIFGETLYNSVSSDDTFLNLSEDELKKVKEKIADVKRSGNATSETAKNILESFGQLLSGRSTISAIVGSNIDGIFKDLTGVADFWPPYEGALESGQVNATNLNRNFGGNWESSVSLASCLLTFLVKPIAASKKYDEIQLIFGPINNRAGKIRSLSMASFPLETKRLKKILKDLYSKNVSISASYLASVLGDEFVNNCAYPAYGFSAAYGKDGELVKGGQGMIDTALKNAGILDYKFQQPRLNIMPECVPHTDDPSKTILRIHVRDNSVQPYDTYSDAISASRNDPSNFIDSLALDGGQKLFIANYPRYLDKAVLDSQRKETIANLVRLGVLKRVGERPPADPNSESTGYNVDLTTLFKGDSRELRKLLMEGLPVIRYGTPYGLIKSMTVSSIQDPQLSTINILKQDEVSGDGEADSRNKGLPLFVNPTEISVEMLGCPLVSYGQSFYVDLGTNTSADNVYAVTGISHKISPGEFSTSLKLTYNIGAYGIYTSSKRSYEITKQVLEYLGGEQFEGLLVEQEKDKEEYKIEFLLPNYTLSLLKKPRGQSKLTGSSVIVFLDGDADPGTNPAKLIGKAYLNPDDVYPSGGSYKTVEFILPNGKNRAPPKISGTQIDYNSDNSTSTKTDVVIDLSDYNSNFAS